jgi:hypothetical protein
VDPHVLYDMGTVRCRPITAPVATVDERDAVGVVVDDVVGNLDEPLPAR